MNAQLPKPVKSRFNNNSYCFFFIIDIKQPYQFQLHTFPCSVITFSALWRFTSLHGNGSAWNWYYIRNARRHSEILLFICAPMEDS